MSQRLTVELSDEVYSMIQRQAMEANISPAEMAAASLDRYFREQRGPGGTGSVRGQSKRNKDELRAARERFESHFGSVDLGHALGLSNEEIDADLEREYASTHERL